MPIGRSDGKAATLFVDGHVENLFPGDMSDMRMWIDAADTLNFRWR